MTRLAWFSLVWAGALGWLTASVSGCNEVTHSDTETVQLAVTATTRSGGRLEGVAVCGMDGASCDATDAEGTGQIAMPIDEEVFWTLEHDDYGIPYYSEGAVWVSLEPDSTTDLGTGGFLEVAPGQVEIEIGGMATRCELGWGWPGSATNTIRVPVQEGHITHASVSCQTSSPGS
jgi:hypothetical protein